MWWPQLHLSAACGAGKTACSTCIESADMREERFQEESIIEQDIRKNFEFEEESRDRNEK